MTEIKLQAMPTPNPNTIKFILDYSFFEYGSIDFPNKEKAQNSPLAQKLHAIEGMAGILIGSNFVSITKTDEAGWETVLEQSSKLIKAIVGKEENLIEPKLIEELNKKREDSSEIVKKILHILDTEIRPAIAMDGGDCEFVSFEDGIVSLRLQGACSSCPSATLTLKMGIENRLKEDLSEVKEVIQI